MKKRRKWILSALLVYIGLSLDLSNYAQGPGWHQFLLNLTASLRVTDWPRSFMLVGLYLLFQKASPVRKTNQKWSLIIPACFFACNWVLGFAFSRVGSWDLLLTVQDGQLLKTVLVFICVAQTAYCALKCLFVLIDKIHLQEIEINPASSLRTHPIRWYRSLLKKHSFLTPFATLLLLYLPVILISFPAVFMGDTRSIIVQAYPELKNSGLDYLTSENILQSGIYINQHHPALYTIILHAFLQLGNLCFHSLNTGIFLFCLLQVTLMISAFSYAFSSLSHVGTASKAEIALLIYAAIHPQIRNYLMLVTKDSAYTACFIFLVSCIFRWQNKRFNRKEITISILSSLGLLLLRNEGPYVLLIAGLIIALIDRSSRRKVLIASTGMLIISLSIYHLVYPRLGFTKGSIREAFSIPFQQTARIVQEHPEDISEEERIAIDNVLDYDQLATRYNPDFADPVKETYRESAANEQLYSYFQVWLRLLIRHPSTGLQATYGNYYQYFFPDQTRIFYESYLSSDGIIQKTNNEIQLLGIQFSLPLWNMSWKIVCDSLVTGGLFDLPVFRLLMTPSFYSWGLLFLLCWIMERRKGKKEGLILCVLPVLQFLIQLAGPTNGYYSRYILPIVCIFPFLICMLMHKPTSGGEN